MGWVGCSRSLDLHTQLSTDVAGWVGWDKNFPWTYTHTRVRVVGRVGGWGGWDVHIPWTCTHNSLRMWRDGWGGWDKNFPWTYTHTRVRVVGRVGGWGGWDVHVPWTWDGWGGIKTFLGLTHILECGWWVGWVGGGVGGMFTFLGLVVYGCGGMGGVR